MATLPQPADMKEMLVFGYNRIRSRNTNVFDRAFYGTVEQHASLIVVAMLTYQ